MPFAPFLSDALTTAELPTICLSCDPGLLYTGVYRLDCAFWRCTTLYKLLLIGFILILLASTISSVMTLFLVTCRMKSDGYLT